jgi:hypothetical protein
MKIAIQVFCVLLFLSGLVWVLQGVNILPGSYMTGDPQWAVNGLIAMIIASGLFFWAKRRRK